MNDGVQGNAEALRIQVAPPSQLAVRIRRVLALDPDAIAIEFEQRLLPWRYLSNIIDRLDAILSEAGLGVGTPVAFLVRNRPAHVGAMLALFATGRVMVTVNPLVPSNKLAADLDKLDTPVVMADEEEWDKPELRAWASRTGAIGLVLRADDASPISLMAGFDTLGAGPYCAPRPGDAIDMLTSGTTGEPKRITLKVETLAGSIADGLRSKDDAVTLKRSSAIVFATLVHVAGVYNTLFSFYEGRSIALLERFSVDAWRAAMRKHRPSFASLMPAVIRMILEAKVPKEDLISLKAVRSGTAPLDQATQDAFEQTYGIPILINYGATEFVGAVAIWTLQDHKLYRQSKSGSVGRARPDMRLRIVDAVSGAVLPLGEQGLLEISTQRLGDGGDWVRTTDIASLDADDFLYIHGRADDAIIRGGFKVLPEQVADVLRQHPGVREAVVVALHDERLGQIPAAAIERNPSGPTVTEADLLALAREKLAPYQVPVRFLIVDELPRTPSMKVARPAVRALFGQ